MAVSVGDVIRYPGTGSGSRLSTAHLHVVVKIDPTKGDYYFVPISSEKANWDNTCEINTNHMVPGVDRSCFAAYFHSKKTSGIGVEAQIKSKICENKGRMSTAIFTKLYDEIFISDETESWFKDAIKPPVVRRVLKVG